MTKNKTVANAINILAKELKTDKDLYRAYQANIAMPFVDACSRHRKKSQKEYLNMKDIQVIANAAAKEFLDIYTKSVSK